MEIFFIMLIVLILSLFFWAEFRKTKDDHSEKVDYSSLVGLKGFVDTESSIFVDKDKKVIPELEDSYLETFVYGRGIRYVPCIIKKVRADSIRYFVHSAAMISA